MSFCTKPIYDIQVVNLVNFFIAPFVVHSRGPGPSPCFGEFTPLSDPVKFSLREAIVKIGTIVIRGTRQGESANARPEGFSDGRYILLDNYRFISTEVTAVASSLRIRWCCTRVHAAYDKLQLPSNIFIFLC
jgi:hypothetical protein